MIKGVDYWRDHGVPRNRLPPGGKYYLPGEWPYYHNVMNLRRLGFQEDAINLCPEDEVVNIVD